MDPLSDSVSPQYFLKFVMTILHSFHFITRINSPAVPIIVAEIFFVQLFEQLFYWFQTSTQDFCGQQEMHRWSGELSPEIAVSVFFVYPVLIYSEVYSCLCCVATVPYPLHSKEIFDLQLLPLRKYGEFQLKSMVNL